MSYIYIERKQLNCLYFEGGIWEHSTRVKRVWKERHEEREPVSDKTNDREAGEHTKGLRFVFNPPAVCVCSSRRSTKAFKARRLYYGVSPHHIQPAQHILFLILSSTLHLAAAISLWNFCFLFLFPFYFSLTAASVFIVTVDHTPPSIYVLHAPSHQASLILYNIDVSQAWQEKIFSFTFVSLSLSLCVCLYSTFPLFAVYCLHTSHAIVWVCTWTTHVRTGECYWLVKAAQGFLGSW